ncbi:MAG: DNA polymerase III subunit delta [Pseudanabaenaceae cyanobacterium]
MPAYFYWGEDEIRVHEAVAPLRARVEPAWLDFNFFKGVATTDERIIEGLNLAATAPFGTGDRLTWLTEVPLGQRCSEELLAELVRTLPQLPPNSHLLFTAKTKPDGRLKAVKWLQKWATITEFSPLPPWDTDAIAAALVQRAKAEGVRLQPAAQAALVEAIGGDLRRMVTELAKLHLYCGDRPVTAADVQALVFSSGRSVRQLTQALLAGQTGLALAIGQELLANNEAPLRLCAALVGQFRTWLLVKTALEAGERDERAIAEFAELGNPKRLFFLKNELKNVTAAQLQRVLAELLALEWALKQGAEEVATLQTRLVTIAQILGA